MEKKCIGLQITDYLDKVTDSCLIEPLLEDRSGIYVLLLGNLVGESYLNYGMYHN